MTVADLLKSKSNASGDTALNTLVGVGSSIVTDIIKIVSQSDTIIEEKKDEIFLLEDEPIFILQKENDQIEIQSEDYIDGIC